MGMVIIHHNVKDYAVWKLGYDAMRVPVRPQA